MCSRQMRGISELIDRLAADDLLLELKFRPVIIAGNSLTNANAKLCIRHWRSLVAGHRADGEAAATAAAAAAENAVSTEPEAGSFAKICSEACALCGKEFLLVGRCRRHYGRLGSDSQLFRVTCALLTDCPASLVTMATLTPALSKAPFLCRACYLALTRRQSDETAGLAATAATFSARPGSYELLPRGVCRSTGSAADCVTVCGCRMALGDLAPWQVSKTVQGGAGQVALSLSAQDTSRCLIVDASGDGSRSYTAQCGDQILETGRLPPHGHACLALVSLLDRLRRLSPCPGLFSGQLHEAVTFLAQLPSALLPRLQVSVDASRGCLQIVRSRRCHGVLERRPSTVGVDIAAEASAAAATGTAIGCCADCRSAVQFSAYPEEEPAAAADTTGATLGLFNEKPALFEQQQLF